MSAHEVAHDVAGSFAFKGYDLKALEAERDGLDHLYFIRIPDGPVKIGRAGNVKRRLVQLQSGCPWKLQIVGILTGGGSMEGHWHTAFLADRMSGEWFEWTERLAEVVASCLASDDWRDLIVEESRAGIERWRLDYIERMGGPRSDPVG